MIIFFFLRDFFFKGVQHGCVSSYPFSLSMIFGFIFPHHIFLFCESIFPTHFPQPPYIKHEPLIHFFFSNGRFASVRTALTDTSCMSTIAKAGPEYNKKKKPPYFFLSSPSLCTGDCRMSTQEAPTLLQHIFFFLQNLVCHQVIVFSGYVKAFCIVEFILGCLH